MKAPRASVRPRFVTALLLFTIAALGIPAWAGCPFAHSGGPNPHLEEAAAGSRPSPHPSLEAVNRYFRTLYSEAKKEMLGDYLAEQKLVIYLEGDSLVLRNHATGQSWDTSITNERYHNYKAVSHTTLAVYLLLEPLESKWEGSPIPLGSTIVGHLRRIRDLNMEVIRNLPSMDWPGPEQFDLQQLQLVASRDYISELISSGKFDLAAMKQFMAAIRHAIDRNFYFAAEEQIKIIDATVRSWRSAHFTEDQWKGLRVIVSSGHMPRTRHLVVQYFGRILGIGLSEGDRIIYSENPDQAYVRDLFATHLVDWGIGSAYFGRGERMHEDALSEGAEEFLDKIYPPGTPFP